MTVTRLDLERREYDVYKPYACFSRDVIRVNVAKHPYRTEFQRDRDRIIHSKAFRRLEYKTQVFLTKQGDHLRTRLTHSLEVAQLSRTVATLLGLNVDLVEAISLGHDLGHTPFGHAGERKLRELLRAEGIHTFKHNVQSVRIVELLEKKYHYDGLKTTIPVKEGILKHTSLPDEMPDYCHDLYINKPFSVTLEGQIVAICDEIAQITHDLDDYLRYNILPLSELTRHTLFDMVRDFYLDEYNTNIDDNLEAMTDDSRKKDLLIRCLVDFLVTRLVDHTHSILHEDLHAFYLDDVYIKFHESLNDIVEDFHNKLNATLFSDFRVNEMDQRGKRIIQDLFTYFKEFPEKLPPETYAKFLTYLRNNENGLLVLADYISGMTDRYALEQHEAMINLSR